MLKYRFTQALAGLTFILLLAGGLVTSTGSGLAVPDWPLSFGGLFPPMVGGIRFEHTHRLIASAIGFLTLVLVIWVGRTEPRAFVRRLAIAALGAVVVQGILGGLTVLHRLPAALSIAHAGLGPLYFCLVVSLAVFLSPGRRKSADFSEERGISPFFPALTAFCIFVQILLGAVVRHTGEGIWFHVGGAFLVFFLTGALVFQTLNRFGGEPEKTHLALFLGFLVTLEWFLGIGAFVYTQIAGMPAGGGQVLFSTFHQAFGSLILAAAVILTLRMRLPIAVPNR